MTSTTTKERVLRNVKELDAGEVSARWVILGEVGWEKFVKSNSSLRWEDVYVYFINFHPRYLYIEISIDYLNVKCEKMTCSFLIPRLFLILRYFRISKSVATWLW